MSKLCPFCKVELDDLNKIYNMPFSMQFGAIPTSTNNNQDFKIVNPVPRLYNCYECPQCGLFLTYRDKISISKCPSL